MPPPILYIAGPYRDPRGPWFIERNIEAARKTSVELAQLGLGFICPHANSAMMDGAAPDSFWLEMDLELLRRSDGVLLLPGWENSSGASAEAKLARKQGLPVYFWPEDKMVLEKLARTQDPSLAPV